MKVSAKYTLDAPQEQVWQAVYDPKSLIGFIPGCQEIEQVSAGEYRGRILMRLPAIVGS